LVAIDKFNNFVIDGVIVREAHFSKRALILSNPMALLRLRALIKALFVVKIGHLIIH